MFRRLLPHIMSAILRHPKAVLLGCCLLVLAAGAMALRVELRTSRSELAPAGDPDQARFEALLREFKGSEAVLVGVESSEPDGPAGAAPRRFVDALAQAIAADPQIEQVFHRLDTAWFLERGLYLVRPEILEQIAAGIETQAADLQRLGAMDNLAALNDAVTQRLARGFEQQAASPAAARRGVEALRALLAAEHDFLQAPANSVATWTRQSLVELLAAGLDERIADPYLSSGDGRTLFLAVIPLDTSDTLPARNKLLNALRQICESVARDYPGVRFGFTGTAAMAVEEMDTVRSDGRRSALISIIGVSLLTFLVFRWRSHALLVLLALGSGVIWSYGAVYLEFGYLNMITSAFVSTLVGVGVAYGIHPVSEYEIEGAHTGDPIETVREAYRRTGAAVAVAALTTSFAFFSIILMRFRGFAQLGLVAGVGVLLCLVAALVALPALMAVHGTWRHGRDRALPRSVSALDRFWDDRAARAICRFPRTVVACGAIATLVAGWAATGLRFNTNLLDLLPSEAESLYFQRKMILDSDLSPVFNVVTAGTLEQLRAMQAVADAEPSIARMDSVLDLLPPDVARSRRVLEDWRVELDALEVSGEPAPLQRESLASSLDRLEQALAGSGEAAFSAGLAELAGPLEQARATAEACLELTRAADAADVAEWNRAQQRLGPWIAEGLARLSRMLRAAPPGVDDLPPELRRRLITGSGRYVGLLYPAGDIFDPRALDAYVDASIRVSGETIGFPFMFRKMSQRITTGFYRSVAAGSLLVALILWIDLRRVEETLLALAPLVVGVVWMLGGMRLLGLSFNFANLVAVPLIIGVGIDNGVHVIHRLRLEGREGMSLVLRHTGRAILIASLTTMVGFGSLAFAAHRGLAGLGVVLLLGVAACLVTSMVLLPNVLIVTGRVRR